MFEECSFGAEMLALCGLVVAQPVLDVFAGSPEWFAYRGARAADIVLFAAAVTLIPPLLLWLVLAPSRLFSRPTRRALHLVTLGTLTALLLLQGLRDTMAWSPPLLVGVSFGLGALVAVLYPAVRALRSWMLALSIAPMVFVALFLGNSATGDLVFASHDVELAASRAESPVVVLLLDELPTASIINADGDVDDVRYPNLARFAQDATWYRNFSTQSGSTVNAVPALLTGREASTRAGFWFEHPDNLFTLLGASHRLHVWEVMTQLCAPTLCRDGGIARADEHDRVDVVRTLLDDARDVWELLIRPDDKAPDPQALFGENELAADSQQVELVAEAVQAGDEPRPWSDFSDELPPVSQPGRFAEFLDAIGTPEPDGTPGLYLAHILLPHQPWRFLPDGSTYAEPSRTLVSGSLSHANDAPWHARVRRQRHVLQTQYADALVGQMIDHLQDVGLYEDALVVVVADHGVGFTPGEGLRILSQGNSTEIMWTPLFIKAPRQSEGIRTDVNAQLPDLLPTIADVLGVEVPWEVDGRSLADANTDDPATGTKRYFLFESANRQGEALEVDAADGLATMLAMAFPAPAGGADWVGGLYHGHPHASLLNSSAASHRQAGGDGPVAVVAALEDLLDGDGPPHVVISGSLRGLPEDARDVHVAVALNGRIVGVSPTEQFGDTRHAFEVLVHPGQFVRGRQELAVYQVLTTDSGARELLELELVAS